MTRVPLPEATEFLDDLPGLTPSIDLGTLNVIRAQGNEPALLAAVLQYVDALYDLLPADVRELTILAVARETRSAYEWHQHVPVALDAGVDDATIQAIGRDETATLPERDRAVVEFVRAQCRGDVTDARYEALARHFTPGEVVVVSRLAGNYAGTADFIEALEIHLEGPFVGWTLDGRST